MRPHFQVHGQNTSNLLYKTQHFQYHFFNEYARVHGSHNDRIHSNLIYLNDFIVIFVGYCWKFSYSRFSELKNSKKWSKFGPIWPKFEGISFLVQIYILGVKSTQNQARSWFLILLERSDHICAI